MSAPGALYSSWRKFAHAQGAEPGTSAEFASAMELLGFTWDRIPPIERTKIRWGLRPR